VTRRIAQLAALTKQRLSEIPGVSVRTPSSRALSAGLVCFTVVGARPLDVVARLDERKIVATTTPYHTRYARVGLTPVNSEADVDELVRVVRIIAATPSVHLGFGPR
jgi:selenocysteine lyase/cysteine desulfurase